MHTSAARRAAVALGLAVAVAVAGCGSDSVVYRPALRAVTSPDSASTGDTIELTVHFPAGGCIRAERIELETIGPRHVRATVLARDQVGGTCTADVGVAVMHARIPLPTAGQWTVDVVGKDTATISIAVGAARPRGGVHRFGFEPRESWGVIPSSVQVQWGNGAGPGETVVLDSLGRGEIELPCAGGEERRREFRSAAGGLPHVFTARPDDCTLPLRSHFFR